MFNFFNKQKKVSDSDSAKEKVEHVLNTLQAKMNPWWKKLANGKILVVYKDGGYKFTSYERHNIIARDVMTHGIVWSGQSSDVLYQFCVYILRSFPKSTIESILAMKQNDTLDFVIQNFSKFFVKFVLVTGKDYTLRGAQSYNATKIAKKLGLD